MITSVRRRHHDGHDGWMVPYVDYLLCLVSVLLLIALASSAAKENAEPKPPTSAPSPPGARVVAAPTAGKQPGRTTPGAIVDTVIDLRILKDRVRVDGQDIAESELTKKVTGKLVVIDAEGGVDARTVLRIIAMVDQHARATYTNIGQLDR